MFGGGGGRDGRTLGRLTHLMMPLPSRLDPLPAVGGGGGGGEQWSRQETGDFIAIRGELERDFTSAKRNKTLWEVVAALKMKERGYTRTPQQCKCKWKNLVKSFRPVQLTVKDYRDKNAYTPCTLIPYTGRGKYGKETSDADNGRQCPFFEELHAVFTNREKNMQWLLLESEAGSARATKRGRGKRISGDKSSDELSGEGDEDENESDEEKITRSSNPRKRKAEKEKRLQTSATEKHLRQPNVGSLDSTSGSSLCTIQEMLRHFLQQQQIIDLQWRELMEKHAHQRQLFEQEWRQSMEKLEKEKLMIEQAWRERDEQRRVREESRAEKRDALLTTLLNKLLRDSHI
ncbi:hypothetical protein RJ639_034145 [Escallonia herrerae]|uniref:Myb-like domain-containing protein n=1 Tax=Escallonia herrerae TaxID=1293975 RepID=A0AA89BBZ4_9ASTE|nr:hypothetical protein RJ639_034145 [Escallonia herrerae]